jgi:ligand-binding sensor domain-containing protein/signal transduction histidine kinase
LHWRTGIIVYHSVLEKYEGGARDQGEWQTSLHSDNIWTLWHRMNPAAGVADTTQPTFCQRETHKATPREWRLISALALSLVVLSTSISAAQRHNPKTPTAVTSEVHRAIPHSIRIPTIDGDDIRFSRLTTAQGLSQTQVAQIVQDDQGFVWFGTQDGLDRYDGYEFRVFTHDPSRENSLSCVYIHSLFKDRSGTLWVGCDQFLDRFDSVHETFTHYRIEADKVAIHVSEISQDRMGMLWLATGSGLFRLNPDTAQIVHYVHDPANPSSLGSNQVRCTLEDMTGRFWVADGENLEEFDRESGRVLWRVRLSEGVRAVSFYEDHLGVFWITYITSSSGSGLAVLDRSTNHLIPYSIYDRRSGKEIPPGLMAAVEDSSKTLWLASFGGGLLKFDREHRVFIRYRNYPENLEGIADDRVMSLCGDREGNVWVGLFSSEPNFFRTERPPFMSLRVTRSNPRSHEKIVNAVYEDHDHVLWIATTGGLNRINPRSGESISYHLPGQGLSSDVIAITEDGGGGLWVGTYGAGISRFDLKTGRFKTYLHEPDNPSSLSSNIVSRMLIDHAGTLWVATYNGLDRFDPRNESFVVYKQDTKSDDEEYFNLSEDKSGFLWMGSWGGLNRFDPETGQFNVYAHRVSDPTSLSDNTVTSVYEDHSGSLWVSTENGLNKLNREGGTFTHYYVKDGLPSNAVSCVLEDQFGMLWMSTNRGLSRFDPVTKRFTNYSMVDGLPGNDFTGWDTCFKSTSGEIFFGGFSGGVAFFPDRVINTSYPLPLVLTDFQLAGRSVEVGAHSPLGKSITYTSDITLTHDQNIFSLSFAALTYFNPEANRYRYRLERLDRDWIEVGSDRRVASYTTLPAGKYTFHVQSATRQGLWNEPGLELKITILPPWWDTWWFRLLCIVAFVGILWTLYLLRLKQVGAEIRARVEERLGERERIARELHDTLLQGIQGLVLRFQAVAERIPPSEPARQMIEKALDRADEVLAEGRDRVKNLRVTSQTNALPDALADAIKDLTLNEAVEFSVVVEGDLRKLNPLVRDEAYWIGHEALVNALHHAGAKRIEVEIAYDPSHLRLRFRDDGCGVDPEIIKAGGKPGHWGMRGMRERAAKIGAHLEIWTHPGAGTELELKILGAVAYTSRGNGSLWQRLRQLWHEERHHESHQGSNG